MGLSGGTSAGGSDGATVDVAEGLAAAGVGVAFSESSPDGVSAPGPEGPGVALGCGPVSGFAAGGFSDARAGVGAAVLSCGVDVVVSVDVAVSGAVSMGVEKPSVMLGGCATVAGTVVVADGAATTVACPVAKDGSPRLGVTAGDPADPSAAVAPAMGVGGPSCAPRPAALVGQLTTVGEPVGETSPCGTLLGPTRTVAPVAAATPTEGADATPRDAPSRGAPRMAYVEAACCGRTVGVALAGRGDESATTGTRTSGE